MPPLAILISLFVGSYLLGAVPFGYLIARRKGIDIFQAGSCNIGATNVGRVLGRKWGITVFVLDFLKGAIPVVIAKLMVAKDAEFSDWQWLPNLAVVGCAVFTFLGHIFPVYLGFRGGKGVATGAGTILVLIPGPALLAFLVWVVVLSARSMVSLSSLLAMVAFMIGHTVNTQFEPFIPKYLLISLYLYVGSLLVIIKHRSNISRLLAGTENRLNPSVGRSKLGLGIHLLALGWIFGASLFLQFIAGLTVFQTFPDVVENAPSDRTAQIAIADGLNADQKKQLANALAGSAIGPMFPRYFLWTAMAAGVALLGSFGSRKCHSLLLIALLLIVLSNWMIADEVSRLRLLRYAADPNVAENAKRAFGSWHVVSLLLSMVTCIVSGVALFLTAWNFPLTADNPKSGIDRKP